MECIDNKGALRVLDVVQFYSPTSGGVKSYIHDKMTFLGGEPDVHHAVIAPGAATRRYREGQTVFYRIKSPGLPASEHYRVLTARGRLFGIALAEQPDVIEVGNPYWSAWMALSAGRRLDVPVVSFYHSDFPRALGRPIGRVMKPLGSLWFKEVGRYLAALYNRMDATLVATARFEKILEDMGVERIVRVPLGTDTTVFTPRDYRRQLLDELNLSEDTFLILYVGRIAREKNVDQLPDMMKFLPGEKGPWHLLVVGDGDYRDTIEKHARENRNVTLWPYVADRERLAEIYSAADLFINSSLIETFGLVAVEAQACGTRVLGVQGGGMEEAMAPEEPFVIAKSHKAPDLARAVEQVRDIGDDKQKQEIRRQYIEEHFSMRTNFTRLKALYRHLADGKPAGDFSG